MISNFVLQFNMFIFLLCYFVRTLLDSWLT
ncbi:hypothetical protein [Lactococcus phage PMBT68]|nr:hypothetical protein [Lactococcus phage P1411]